MDDKIFKISVVTSFSESEIRDFLLLTGLKTDRAHKLLRLLCDNGIHSLKDVNILVKLGYFKPNENDKN